MNEKHVLYGVKPGSSVVAVGLGLAAVGFAGRYIFKQLPNLTTKMNEAIKSFPAMDMNSKYYKGGFEPQMTKREACLILGISPSASKIKIKEAHKRIMLLNHPDRGGSPYLAAKINEAKDFIESNK
ncbi:Mitochondrial import inner membrane translocase subunit tim14 [Polyplax serrata]|uniref:Mitochondrial import inner membrane translocase subunit tim14 n=1 Tax=Polyplax serrata TaxID=468196 RepID=A0AAN8XNP5_POLSC